MAVLIPGPVFTAAGMRAIIRSGWTNGRQAFFMPCVEHNNIVVGGSPPSRRRKAWPLVHPNLGTETVGFRRLRNRT